MKKLVLVSMLCIGLMGLALAQDAPKDKAPERRGPPQITCETAKKLMEQMREHRQNCEVCKKEMPPRGPRGEGKGKGPGPGHPPQK